jgi:hypothetical protein
MNIRRELQSAQDTLDLFGSSLGFSHIRDLNKHRLCSLMIDEVVHSFGLADGTMRRWSCLTRQSDEASGGFESLFVSIRK